MHCLVFAGVFVLAAFLVSFVIGQTAFAADYTTTITYNPDPISDNREAQFGYDSDAPEMECKIDDGDFEPCGEDFFRSSILELGEHTFTVHGVGGTNPESTDSYTWEIVDDADPDPNTTLGDIYPSSPSRDLTPSFTFEPDDPGHMYLQCSVDGSPFDNCSSPFTVPAFTSGGAHQFEVRAVRFNVNVPDPTPASLTWNVDYPIVSAEIDSCEELADITDLENNYVLTQDIDCNEQAFVPIGDEDTPFKGSLDGDGFTISNLSLSGSGDCGMFGYMLGAQVDRLHINNAELSCTGDTSGTLAAIAEHTDVANVIVTNNVITGATDSGGLFGNATEGSITRSYADSIITANGAGGLIGFAFANLGLLISDSYTTGTLDCYYCGGMIGQSLADMTINDSYTNVEFIGDTGSYGGFIGYLIFRYVHVNNSFSASSGFSGLNQTGGFAGEINTATVFVDNFAYDKTRMPTNMCHPNGDDGCTAIENSSYFLGRDEPNAPMEEWDDTFWNLHNPGELPSFTVGVVQCDDPDTITEASYDLICAFQRELQHRYTGDALSKQIRYRKHGSNGSWQYSNWSLDSMHLRVCGLEADTRYDIQLHSKWQIFSSDWHNDFLDIETQATARDDDNDGAKDSQEVCGPNDGDANNDGTYDREQGDIASVKSPLTNKQVVLQSDCAESQFGSLDAESSSHKDAGYGYANGLMGFTLTGCGTTATVTQYYFGNFDPTKLILRKYNPSHNSYTTIPGATLSRVTIGNQQALKLVYEIIDNGPLDLDPAIGTIHDPAGLAEAAVDTPNTGLRPL